MYQQETKYVIPLSIKIKMKRNNKVSFRHSRIVVAIFNAMKKVHQETAIGPIMDNEGIAPVLHQPTEVPLN
jgi:hypothetical protein